MVQQQFHWTGDDTDLQGYADSDWARDRQNMKSTSGGVIMRSGHCIKRLGRLRIGFEFKKHNCTL